MGWSCGLPAFATTARPVGDPSSGDQIDAAFAPMSFSHREGHCESG
jgi:hypothetical protein